MIYLDNAATSWPEPSEVGANPAAYRTIGADPVGTTRLGLGAMNKAVDVDVARAAVACLAEEAA